jgi:hypothetical protein
MKQWQPMAAATCSSNSGSSKRLVAADVMKHPSLLMIAGWHYSLNTPNICTVSLHPEDQEN